MKKLIVGLVMLSVVSACRSSANTTPSPVSSAPMGAQTGAVDPVSALRGFLDAAKAQNLQGISAFWGDQDGTVRGRFPKAEEEQREIIIARCLRHDRYDVVGDAPAVGGGRTYAVSLTRPGRTATTNIDVVPASDRRWYVQKVDMEKLTDYCR